MNAALEVRTAAVVGFIGVVFGAFAAHGLEELFQVDTNRRMEAWNTAVFYHLVHAVVLLVVGLTPRVSKVATISLLVGIVFFSGSLYLEALTNLEWFGLITPVGGVGFLIGWAGLAGRLGMRGDPEESSDAASEADSGASGEAGSGASA